MERKLDRSPDVERAASRLSRPRARVSLVLKRLLDVVLSAAMLVAATPVFIVVGLLLLFDGERFIEQRTRLTRHGEPAVVPRFPEPPGRGVGRPPERARRRELAAVVAGPPRRSTLRRP